MKKVIFSAGLALFVLASCNNNDSASDIDKSIIPEGQTVPGSTDAASASTAAPGMPMMGENPAMQPVQVNPQTVVTGGATGPLNPKHGEPGHRCDIAEGAPLNSKPAANPASAATAPTITQVAAPTPTPAKVTAPGMNPPHGQPGHRCDIAEGAPLNSKPAAPKTEATPVQVTPVQAAPAAIKAEETKAAQPAAPAAAEEGKKEGN